MGHPKLYSNSQGLLVRCLGNKHGVTPTYPLATSTTLPRYEALRNDAAAHLEPRRTPVTRKTRRGNKDSLRFGKLQMPRKISNHPRNPMEFRGRSFSADRSHHFVAAAVRSRYIPKSLQRQHRTGRVRLSEGHMPVTRVTRKPHEGGAPVYDS